MGYTIQNKKIVIWTEKVFEADEWPFNDEGTNWTYFYKNLKDIKHFAQTLAARSDKEKKEMIAESLGLEQNSFIIKSKKAHYKEKKT